MIKLYDYLVMVVKVLMAIIFVIPAYCLGYMLSSFVTGFKMGWRAV